MRTEKKDRHPLLLLTDSLSSRVFFSSGIIKKLWKACQSDIEIISHFDIESVFDYRQWLKSDENISDSSLSINMAHPNNPYFPLPFPFLACSRFTDWYSRGTMLRALLRRQLHSNRMGTMHRAPT